MTSEFDPDKWWTWPIPEIFVMGRRANGAPNLTPEGSAWLDGFEAGWGAYAEQETAWKRCVPVICPPEQSYYLRPDTIEDDEPDNA